MSVGLQPWKAAWLLAFLLSGIRLGSCARRHRLWVPDDHVALNGDVTVEFQRPRDDVLPNGVLELRDLSGSDNYRTEKGLPNRPNGNVSFECSYFDHAGEFEVRMLRTSGGEILATSSVIHVTWPIVNVIAPRTHVALEGGIAVTVTTTANLCTDMQYNRYENSVVLLYHDVNRTLSQTEMITSSHGSVVVEREVGTLTAVHLEQFECQTIDRAGIYSFIYCSSYRRLILGTSQPVEAAWSGRYRVTFPRETVFPCPDQTAVEVSFDAPNCRGDRDKIRVYAETGRFELRPTGTLDYVTEVTVMGTSVIFDCSHFSLDHLGYCFVYVSTAKNGAVDAHRDKILCVPVEAIGPPVDGSWSVWSDWGACTVTCGEGQRNRYRLCNNPPAANGGALCVGETVMSQLCNYGVCPAHTDPTDMVSEPTVKPNCTCGGCTLHADPGGIIASSPYDCTSPLTEGTVASPGGQVLTWLVVGSDHQRVRLEFRAFNLHPQEEWMRIRDGGDQRAKVLAYHTGSRLPAVVESTGNRLYIEYKVYSGGEPDRGFRVRYSSLDGGIPPTTPVAAGSTGDEEAAGLNLGSINNTVMMVGIFLCAAVILVSIVITVFTGCRKSKSATEIELRPNPGPGSSIASAGGGQRPWGPPGHSCSSQSEMSHQSGKRGRPDGHLGDRSQLYMVQDEGLAYLPESNVSLSSPYHTHSSDTTGVRRPPKIPEDKIPSPYHSPRTDFIQMERLRKVGLPYHIGTGSSQSEVSRHSGRTDKNTTTLATKTPEYLAMRGYSAAGSLTSFEQKYGSLPRSDHRSDNRSEHRNSDQRHSDQRHSDHRHSDNRHSDHKSDHHHSDHRSDHRSDHGFDSNLPCVNKEGQLTPLGMALSRNQTFNQNEFRTPEVLPHIPEGQPAPVNHVTKWPPTPNEGRTVAEINRNTPVNRKKSAHGENSVHPVGVQQPLVNGESPSGQRPRKLPLTPRQAFFEDTESLGVVTPMTDISSKDNMQIRSPRSTFSPKKNEVVDISNKGVTSPLSSPGELAPGHTGNSKRFPDRNNSGAGGRSKRKKIPHASSARKTRKSESKRTSSGDEDGRTAAKLALYSTAESDDASATNLLSEPTSPVRIPELDKKQNTDRLKSVFISDESLAKTFSGGESSRSGMTPRTPRRLPNTPPSGFSPTSNKLKSVLVYSDFSIDQDEPEYDDFIPNLPGTFFENQTPLPTGLSPARKKNQPLKKSSHSASAV
ncbi:uncharacterized protein LOC110979812 [Acanthaster planci]|uniref:Uncharacterized protein LOC110979812 n=1 Tax=Acanthaster planci TaxID=133434 RepID=A0A8B7YG65_ACAPL|nr:uncharacterized protein LOC110979812 [Acanthaster planci]XP_022091583.1 uncharacterized protein LOC110979812 [Acanthaster planci]XP_022091584.1 uncharacterized protein LOC110979812 [Acanthaster planci]XP_022091585.1 uncharacterized protein LOC110979812 [Acanthaster planci]XP_022091586.1 uncharacterized protein LOC110979812 [Acanthaster planci]XP_022091587.1 uncharacterized protein LOC110979812 [Acanthaster planci]XP_022091588.1 uncharacterized protein LOC110979812 [Acanthaster planci]XP_0